jgi:predicted Zn-dependent peptidase
MTFKKTVLPNGLRIITAVVKDSPTATALVLVEAGSKYEDKRINGISHFLEHMCFKGTKNRPTAMDITKELDGLGAQSNAFTSQEFTGYWAKAQAGNLPQLIDIVSDIYLNQLFDANEIEKEKGVIVQEINMYEDMPMRHVHDLFMEVLYGDQPAGWNVAGQKEGVVKLTREDFLAYRDKHYHPPATIVMIAGGFDEEKVLALVKEKFSKMKEGKKEDKSPVRESQQAPQALIQYKDTDQTHLVLGVRSKNIFDKDTYTLDVLAAVLGGGMSSRLFHKIREEMGAAYYVKAGNDSYTDHGVLAVSVGSDNNKVFDVIKATLEEWKRITREKVPMDELEKVKRYLIGHLFLDVESTDSLANFLGLQEVLMKKILSPEEVAKKIEAVTAEDVMRVAQEIFKNDRLNLALIGPFKSEGEFISILKL